MLKSEKMNEEIDFKSLFSNIVLISGNSNIGLAKKISEHLNIPIADSIISKFSDGEIRVKILENVRGKDVFIIQSTCPPVNDNLMELLIIIDAVRRASAGTITAIIPYFGYAKQEKKVSGREPITAKLVANLLTVAGANRVVTIELHAPAIQGFFDIPVDNLQANNILIKALKDSGILDGDLSEFVVLAPDAGSVIRSRIFAEKIGLPIAVMFKRRPDIEEVESMEVVGDIMNKKVIIVDDMISTAKTLVKAANKIIALGAKEVYAVAVHPVFVSNAIKIIEESDIKKVIVTDTIPLNDELKSNNKIIQVSVSELLSEVIKRIYLRKSISELFD
ncbi:MAG: ribose-phosphate pyrophosphokinase [bacterium]|nr:ribose-phosphate pyrophosphokinase [bacterium]